MTATCTVPPRPQNPAPWWHYKPQIVHALPSGLSGPNSKRDNAFAIRDALRAERRGRTSDQLKADAIDKRDLVKRSADAPTVTVTETTSTITSTVSQLLLPSQQPKLVHSRTNKSSLVNLHRHHLNSPNNCPKHHNLNYHLAPSHSLLRRSLRYRHRLPSYQDKAFHHDNMDCFRRHHHRRLDPLLHRHPYCLCIRLQERRWSLWCHLGVVPSFFSFYFSFSRLSFIDGGRLLHCIGEGLFLFFSHFSYNRLRT